MIQGANESHSAAPSHPFPPGPINNPGIESIKAALYPEDVDFLFFVARGDGYHTFTRTEKEHNKAKKEFQKIRRKNKKINFDQ